MRQSIAAAALIRRTLPGGVVQWLTNWNEGWSAFHLIGGSREVGESFRDCCARELEEETGLVRDRDFRVAPTCQAHLEYTAESRRTGTLTAYTTELFDVELLTDAAHEEVDTNPECQWVTNCEIQSRLTSDGRPISPTTGHLLIQAGLIPSRIPGGAGDTI